MDSGRHRLIEAARSLLAEHPDREPSTRELYEAAGVAAPTLYHHFGTKEGLLEAVVSEAFSEYLERKHAVPETGDPIADFATGWDMHVEFGIRHPVLYRLMFTRTDGGHGDARQVADAELRRQLTRLADAGLLQLDVDDAVAVTTGMAFGCVTQLIHDGGDTTGTVAQTMRRALIAELTGSSSQQADFGAPGPAARSVLAGLGAATGLFTPAEEGLLRQWLRTLTEHFERTSTPHPTRTPQPTRKKGNR